jgi:hypothetical protein
MNDRFRSISQSLLKFYTKSSSSSSGSSSGSSSSGGGGSNSGSSGSIYLLLSRSFWPNILIYFHITFTTKQSLQLIELHLIRETSILYYQIIFHSLASAIAILFLENKYKRFKGSKNFVTYLERCNFSSRMHINILQFFPSTAILTAFFKL